MAENKKTKDKYRHSWLAMVLVSLLGAVVIVSTCALVAFLAIVVDHEKASERYPAIASNANDDPVPTQRPDDITEPASPSPTVDKKAQGIILPPENPSLSYEVEAKGSEATIIYTDIDYVTKTDTIKDTTWIKSIRIEDDQKKKRASVITVSQKGQGSISCKISQRGKPLSEETAEGTDSLITCQV